MQKRRLMTGLVLCLVLASCKKEADPIIGRWEEVGGNGRAEYLADGSALIYDDAMPTPLPISGTWKRIEDGRIKIEAVFMGTNTAALYQVEIEGDTATFKDSEGVTERYQRAKAPASAPAENPQARNSEAQRRTVADMRNVGTAMFSWLTDQIGAAAAGQPQTEGESQRVELQQYTPISRQDLAQILVPLYLIRVPEKDGWGHAYEFYLDTKSLTGHQVMGIRSPGRDGRFSANDYTAGSFEPTDFDQDIVWSDGYFTRWPQAPPR